LRMYHLLVDDRGQRWPAFGWDTANFVSAPFTGRALADYVVTNLGWVEIRRNQHHFHIRCRPAIAADPAVVETLFTLCDTEARSITLSVLGKTWNEHVHCNRSDVITILASMMGTSRIKLSTVADRFLCDEVPPESSPFLEKLRHAFANASTQADITSLVAVLNATFNGRWTLTHTDHNSGQAIVDHCGPGFTRYNPRWQSSAVGTSLHSYADPEYGAWVASHRRQVELTGHPRFDNVDAVVGFPGLGEVRLTYARLTAALDLSRGRRFVLAAAQTDVSVDLRKIGRSELHHVAN
jgi:hypothetical protein